MEIKNRKFLNENIIKSLAIAAVVLSVIGVALNLMELYDENRYSNDFYWIGSRYVVIACIIMLLIYIAQVFWLQKSDGSDESEAEGFHTFTINTYSIIAFIFLIISTGFGKSGIVHIGMIPNPFFTVSDYIVIPTLLILFILAAIAVFNNNKKIIIAIVLISAVYAVINGGYSLDYGVSIIPLIYAFAYWDSISTRNNNESQDGVTEVLLLSIIKITGFLISTISFIYSIALFGFDGDYYVMPYLTILMLISGILLFISWKKNSFVLLVTAIILEILYLIIPTLINFIRILSIGLDIANSISYESILLPLLTSAASPITVFFVIAFIKMYNRKIGVKSISINIKPMVTALILVAVISYAAGILIPQFININDFYNSADKSDDRIVTYDYDEEMPEDVEI